MLAVFLSAGKVNFLEKILPATLVTPILAPSAIGFIASLSGFLIGLECANVDVVN